VKHEPVRVAAAPSRTVEQLIGAGVVIVAAIVIFYRLGDPAIYWWDEARVAINSLEMMRHPGLVVTYNGAADLWNTKPPLAIWLNALSMRLFGVNEWALRLPSALAAIGTVVATFRFAERISDRRAGILAALMLLGMGGYVEVHVARTADFDALLVLFSTLATFSLFFALQTKRFWPTAAWGAAAVMTKGVAGAMMAPGFVLYALLTRQDVRRAILPALAALGGVALFYAVRELVQPGYLAAVLQSDIMRYGFAAEGNGGPRTAYLMSLFRPWQLDLAVPAWSKPLYTASAFPWSLVALAALWRPSRAALYLWCCLGSFLLVVSLAATRLGWYIAPAFPLIAVLAALGARRWFWLALPIAIGCIGFNVWKIEKTVAVAPQHFIYTTPDGKVYRGPDEFYSAALGS
jgi:4-amino-4-deoxy-L-arabinose transferase-like glycosyltransferase